MRQASRSFKLLSGASIHEATGRFDFMGLSFFQIRHAFVVRTFLFFLGTLFCYQSDLWADAEPTLHGTQLNIEIPGWTPQPFLNWQPGDTAHEKRKLYFPRFIYAEFDKLRENNVQPFATYSSNFLGNPVGGALQSAQYAQILRFGAEISLKKISPVFGETSLIISGVQGSGRNLSDWIGNDLGVMQAYTSQTIALSNLLIRQQFFNDKLEVRLGRMGAGQFFGSLPAFGLQVSDGINGNAGGLPSNLSNFKTSTGTSWAAYAKWTAPQDIYLQSGIFQSNPNIGKRAYHGLNLGFHSDDGFLWMAEIGWTPTFYKRNADGKGDLGFDGLPAYYGLGTYWSNYEFSDFDGGSKDNAFGFYAMGQQMLWRSAYDENLHFSVWGVITYAPQSDIAINPLFGGFGTILQGFIPSRKDDQWLTSFLIQNYGANYARSIAQQGTGNPSVEIVLETSYIIQLTENISFQPDLQYVIQPAGTGNIPNALVVGFQITAKF
ncbi:MAG: carbohydrate porin [Chthoniobacterales bacterium]